MKSVFGWTMAVLGLFLAAQLATARADTGDGTGEALKEKVAGKRAERAEKRKEAIAEKREALKEKREAVVEKRKEAREKREAETTPKANERVETRQTHQAKRIDHGIKKGYLTSDEIAKLDAQQKDIETMQQSFNSDGKLTKDERQQLHQALDTASRCIWGEKHDTEGNQMATYRLGKNVFAKDDFTAKMEDPNLSGVEAKALCKDFHRVVTLKRKLSTDDLTDEQRTKLQAEYNDLLNRYFEVR